MTRCHSNATNSCPGLPRNDFNPVLVVCPGINLTPLAFQIKAVLEDYYRCKERRMGKVFVPKEILMNDPSWVAWWTGKSKTFVPLKAISDYIAEKRKMKK